MDTSRMLITPSRLLPAHIFPAESLCRQSIVFVGREWLSPEICSSTVILPVCGIEDIDTSPVCSHPYFCLNSVMHNTMSLLETGVLSGIAGYQFSLGGETLDAIVVGWQPYSCWESMMIPTLSFPYWKGNGVISKFLRFICSIPCCQLRHNMVSGFHICMDRIMNGSSVLNSRMREIVLVA